MSESLSDRAYQILRDRLIMLDIAPGEPINEAQLVLELNIGRTPLREALKRLEVDHLVHPYPRRGTFATRVDITELAAITEMRLALEPLAADRAAALGGGSVRREIEQTLHTITTFTGDETRRNLMENDLAVHRLIYQAAANHHLEETLIRLDNLATRIWCLTLDRLPSIDAHIAEHQALLEAVLNQDPETASTLARDHIASFETSVRAVL